MQEARQGYGTRKYDTRGHDTHRGGCTCGGCTCGAREGHRRAVAAFLLKRDELAAGQGLPAALAHSAGASRRWVSDELTRSARAVGERGRAERDAWLAGLWPRTVGVVWGGVGVLLLVQALTAAAGAGWTVARTAGLVAAAVTGGLLTAAGRLHRSRGGVLAPLIGEDNRLSTSRAAAAGVVLLCGYAVLVLAVRLVAASGRGQRAELVDGLRLGRSAGLLTVLAVVCAVAVLARWLVGTRVLGQRSQKVRAARPRGADLLTDDAGRGSFTDVQYVAVTAAAVVWALARLARRPDRLPDLPWGLAVLVVVSAATYLAGKYAEGGRPVIHSVVRAREAGDLDAPVRTGDDIEIRGAGFVPPGAGGADQLARLAVRIGAVHVHVPLVPVPGGFTNPTDTVVTVPVPADVEPGRVEVQVITASGAGTNPCVVDVVD
ncbi:hypothetical protein OFY01_01080 [Streptomyces sp. GXMU-J5]|uniref:Integral membrane protein n=1 Tax=Streptomyces beihaiensis TaxID=2984495 RepID=A0ABT3TMY4_9ACTN|nr:hypothetical protein [Streptomyces beihaiensis]MCX3058386.1 hypothetical protein [Streptomyces beihaiensis]